MTVIERILDVIYPPRCIICGEIAVRDRDTRFYCEKCLKEIPWVRETKRCHKCTRPLDDNTVCEVCAKHNSLYDEAVSVFDYAVVKDTIEDYKFNGNKYLSKGFGDVMFRYAEKFYPQILKETDIICPLPIHKDRLKERGFDQSKLLARIIADKADIAYCDALERTRYTKQQSLLTGYKNRAENVRDAFKVINDVSGKTVMLIDDVLTTGSSASECAKVLKKAGAKKIIVYCLSASFKPLDEFKNTDYDDNDA